MTDARRDGRLLLGPGPSPVSPGVMRALSTPVLGHLDPAFLPILDEVQSRLATVFHAGQGSFTLAISGTGTSGMEAAVSNLVRPGTKVLSVITGYFGDRLAEICRRAGAEIRRVDVEWGRACDPGAVKQALAAEAADIVTVVHGETSTGVVNPVEAIAREARAHDALTIVDAVTSLGAHPVDVSGWDVDVCYSCTQKGLGAPSGLAPLTFSARAMERRVECRSFYLDLILLEDYWVRRKYHHTISAPLIYALNEALGEIEDEGLDARAARHQRHHLALAAGLSAMGLDLLPPAGERLWTLNAVRVPAGVDEAAVRRHLLGEFNIEIGAGLGPLAGRIWRVGLMGSGSTPQSLLLLMGALEHALRAQDFTVQPGAGTAAVVDALANSAVAS